MDCLFRTFLLVMAIVRCCFGQISGCSPTSSWIFQSEEPVSDWRYINIEDVRQLHFECDIATYKLANKSEYRLTLMFNNVIINQSIDFRPFENLKRDFQVSILGIRGFDLAIGAPFFQTYFNNADERKLIEMSIKNSVIDFYYRDVVIDENLCNENLINTNGMLFTNVRYLTIIQSSFTRSVCPFVFKLAVIDRLILSSLEVDNMERQNLEFLDVKNNNELEDFQINIQQLHLKNIYNYKLTSRTLKFRVFSSCFLLHIEGNLDSIEDGVFKDFRLNYIEIKLVNMRSFLQSSTNKWMAFLHHRGKALETKRAVMDTIKPQNPHSYLSLGLHEPIYYYSYPTEDLCLFKYFPYKKAIITELQLTYPNGGPCTVVLLQRSKMYMDSSTETSKLYEDEVEKCDLARRLEVCFNSSFGVVKKPSFYLDYYSSIYMLKWIDYVGPVLTFPFFAGLAFLLNLLVILIITSKKNKKENLFESKIFAYILANSIFNCIECLIYELRLINLCISRGSLFCSSIKSTQFSLFMGTYVTGYIGEVVKTCSMLTGLLFSIQRYIETSKTKRSAFTTFDKFKIRNILVVVVVASFVLSLNKIFETNRMYNGDSLYDTPMQFALSSRSTPLSNLWIYVYFFHYIVNDFVLLVINLIVDLKLVLVIRDDMAKKMKFCAGSSNTHEQKKFLEKKREIKLKTNMLIILNFIIYTLCRVPELIVYTFFFFYIPHDETRKDCSTEIICYLLHNVAEYLYMLAYAFNIVIYYKFNSNFEAGMKNFFNLKNPKNVL